MTGEIILDFDSSPSLPVSSLLEIISGLCSHLIKSPFKNGVYSVCVFPVAVLCAVATATMSSSLLQHQLSVSHFITAATPVFGVKEVLSQLLYLVRTKKLNCPFLSPSLQKDLRQVSTQLS